MKPNSKITAEHLCRKAVIYLRQSSLTQVKENTESLRLQYALEDRARDLGFERVECVDSDLGVSAAVAGGVRLGFDYVISAVARGEVGIVMSREVSRLARSDKDWCRLLEVCQVFDTLIGEEDQIYDLSLMDDQLVLGIKGTLSVVELKVLRRRLLAGREEKARRGELFQRLPTGYVLDAAGKVVLDPDQRVQAAIGMVFTKYRELWSVRQTCQWFWSQEVKLPVNKCLAGTVRLVWQLPKHSYVRDVLTNPFYAGAYFWGRGGSQTVYEDGRLIKKRKRPARRPETCKYFIWDHHECYIDRRTYEENQEIMSRNQFRGNADPAVAAVRSGQALLAGLLRCGKCGHKYQVRYAGRKGTSARYGCVGDYDEGGNYCNSFTAKKVDQRVGEQILEVISPLGVEASLAAFEKLRGEEDHERRSLALELEQLDYEVQRAADQYEQVDARNRLVAAELERRWNAKLEEREAVREAMAAVAARNRPLSAEENTKIRTLGEDFARVWASEKCPMELKKKITWTLIRQIVADVVEGETGEMIRLVIHWAGGVHTSLEMPRPGTRFINKTCPEALDVIRKMAVRYADYEIAGVLNKLGLRTGKGLRWNVSRVTAARRSYSISGHLKRTTDPEILTLREAVACCKVPANVIRRLVNNGVVTNNQVVPMAPWELRRCELDSERVRAILDRYRETGKYRDAGGVSPGQKELFYCKKES